MQGVPSSHQKPPRPNLVASEVSSFFGVPVVVAIVVVVVTEPVVHGVDSVALVSVAERASLVSVVVLVHGVVEVSVNDVEVDAVVMTVSVVGTMPNADWNSYVRPSGSQTVPGAQSIASLHWPDAHRWKLLVMQYQAPSLSAQEVPTGWALI